GSLVVVTHQIPTDAISAKRRSSRMLFMYRGRAPESRQLLLELLDPLLDVGKALLETALVRPRQRRAVQVPRHHRRGLAADRRGERQLALVAHQLDGDGVALLLLADSVDDLARIRDGAAVARHPDIAPPH